MKFWGIFRTLVLFFYVALGAYAAEPCRALLSPTTDQEAEWNGLKEPVTEFRPRGLDELRKEALEHGLTWVLDESRPSSQTEVDALEYLFGSRVVFTKDIPRDVQNPFVKLERGVAFHTDRTVREANRFRAKLNPHLGFGRLHGILTKWNELVFASEVDPKAVPNSFLITEVTSIGPNWVATRNEGNLVRELKAIWKRILERFPQGAFIKNVADFATVERGGMITTDLDPEAIARKGISALRPYLPLKGGTSSYYEQLKRKLRKNPNAETRFLAALLLEPETVFVQEKLGIAKTPLGHPLEVRVDFLDGEAVSCNLRHSTEFLPEMEREAALFLNSFFEKAPLEYRHLSGGADIMFLKNGGKRFIEFNFAAESEYIDPTAGYPVIPNLYLSKLLGRLTPLIRDLDALSGRSITEQAQFLNHLDTLFPKRSIWAKTFSRVSLEAFRYLRDRMIERFKIDPSQVEKERIRTDLRRLALLIHQPVDSFKTYLEEADDALERICVEAARRA